MRSEGKNILVRFLKRWQSMLVLETLLYGLGASVMIYFLNQNLLISIIVFLLTTAIASLFIKPWKVNLQSTSSFLDFKLESAEYSSGLFLASWDTLSDLAKLQQIKVSKKFEDSVKAVRPPGHLSRSIITSSVLILAGFLVYHFNLINYFQSPTEPNVPANTVIFKTKDSTNTDIKPPKLIDQWVTIRYPKYTNIKSFTTSKMNIKALEGSQVHWKLKFDSDMKRVFMESMSNDYPMILHEQFYRKKKTVTNSGFYNFKFEDVQGTMHSSDLYAIDVFKDEPPEIKLQGLKQFTSFNYDDEKILQFNSIIIDDFGIAQAHIIATVSKGSGESVKFREEKLSFDSKIDKGSKKLTLFKKIHLDDMKMEPGDELYFYVETSDLKEPEKNVSRSETYFAVIKDTTSYEFGIEGTLGVNRMPDYFRSQRQLIIDTEKLIRERKKLTKEEFNFKSNGLGFDQKTLRLKYGEFMGVESDSGLDIQEESPEAEIAPDSEDPLAEYTHDHDGDNEHNLVDTKDQEKNKASKNPLQEFMHEHEDSEMATQFEESLKAKMYKAMSEMWDAELYLRLYEPKKSLPYQYKALKLIQDIKNHARIYVHRIGFDPPPIKEDKRLTGKLDKVSSYRKSEDVKEKEAFLNIKLAILKLEEIISKNVTISENDKELFKKATTELSEIAIEFPGKHLKTLQQLKRIAEGIKTSKKAMTEVRQGLLLAIPKPDSNPTKTDLFLNNIDRLLLKELDLHD